MVYYVLRDKNTGLYWRGKGKNRWGKYFNQASVYRIKGQVENTVEELAHRGIHVEIVPIRIFETAADVVEVVCGEWKPITNPTTATVLFECSVCGNRRPSTTNFCPSCGARMMRSI